MVVPVRVTRSLRALAWGAALWLSWSWASTTGPALHAPTAQRPRALSPEVVRAVAELAVAEDPEAVEAVAWVVRNRAGRRDVLAVLSQDRQWGTRKGGVWISSWPKPASWARAHAGAIEAALPLVRAVLEGRTPDPTDGATHFHRKNTWTPGWAPPQERWCLIGSHYFYRVV